MDLANFSRMYDLQEQQNNKEYILHDGPPYANGRLHMGHALNKILKDVTIRYKLLKGHKVSFIPGWDCHGLPIELKALERAQKKKETKGDWENFGSLEIRSKARTLAEETIKTQKRTFEQWGLFVNWDKCYCTNNPSYVSKQLKLFSKLYDKGYIFQSYMPVHFSPSSGTSLAESELEYVNTHESPSLYLALPITGEGTKKLLTSDVSVSVYLSIWTTTPWTLPANMAICIDESKRYCLVETIVGSRRVALVWIEDRIEDLPSILKAPFKVINTIQGKDLKEVTYIHPLNGTSCPVIPSTHVSSTKGTGLVHNAPAHGKEDFLVALHNGIPTNIQLIDEKGLYKEEAGEALHGKHVLEQGNDVVIQLIRDSIGGATSSLILNLDTIVHSYPYDWRTKKPTIVRASKQWFFDISKIRSSALRALEGVRIHPEKLRKKLVGMVEGRPYWCISRQRVWGVPIPVFYEPDTGEPILRSEIIDHVASLVEAEGGDVWWKYSEEKLLPPQYVRRLKEKGQKLPIKGTDIMDIWFDSGSSWHCAMDGKKVDLYLEGHDQTNGWFQSSLLIGVAATGHAPYKALLMHGFTVDEHYQKMSKSLKNVFDPQLITNGGKDRKKHPAFGANILRWWALSSTPVNDVPFGMETIQSCENDVKAIRITFSFFLGSLINFNPRNTLELDQLRIQDLHVLSLIKPYLHKIWHHFEHFEYDRITLLIYDFIVKQIGNEYMNSTKDMLYFELENETKRQSVLTTIYLIMPYLLLSISPILPLLAEEVSLFYNKIQDDNRSGITCCVDPPANWNQGENVHLYQEFLRVKKCLWDKFQEEKIIDADYSKYKVNIKVGEYFQSILRILQSSKKDNHSELCSIFKVSEVTIELDESLEQDFRIEISNADGEMCARCRKFAAYNNELCSRCEQVLGVHQLQ